MILLQKLIKNHPDYGGCNKLDSLNKVLQKENVDDIGRSNQIKNRICSIDRLDQSIKQNDNNVLMSGCEQQLVDQKYKI